MATAAFGQSERPNYWEVFTDPQWGTFGYDKRYLDQAGALDLQKQNWLQNRAAFPDLPETPNAAIAETNRILADLTGGVTPSAGVPGAGPVVDTKGVLGNDVVERTATEAMSAPADALYGDTAEPKSLVDLLGGSENVATAQTRSIFGANTPYRSGNDSIVNTPITEWWKL